MLDLLGETPESIALMVIEAHKLHHNKAVVVQGGDKQLLVTI